MVAKATPCGSTINAPVRPAIRSSRAVLRVTMGHQRRKGRNLWSGPDGTFIAGADDSGAIGRWTVEGMNISRVEYFGRQPARSPRV